MLGLFATLASELILFCTSFEPTNRTVDGSGISFVVGQLGLLGLSTLHNNVPTHAAIRILKVGIERHHILFLMLFQVSLVLLNCGDFCQTIQLTSRGSCFSVCFRSLHRTSLRGRYLC